MDYRTFREIRKTTLATRPDVVDLAETNIYDALAALRPSHLNLPEAAHRCDLVERWLKYFGLPAEWKPRVLAARGVRHALTLLFGQMKQEGRVVLVPSDVYPVYEQIAQRAGLEYQTYPTYGEVEIPVNETHDVVLITDPVKPVERRLRPRDVSRLRAWLAGATHRRVVVDAVYLLENVFSSEMVELIESGQTIVLHSLSKGWLRPQIFGVALVPEDDVQPLTPTFRAEPAERDALREAWALLTVHDDMPSTVTGVLIRAEGRLRELVTLERGFRLEPLHTVGARYHFIVPTPWRTLLREYGLLTLPFSVFGGPDAFSVATSLTTARADMIRPG